ncbi:MAG TPA: 4Fe-4S binding protein [Clostridiaceae bacterium]|nr:4Fe-4S binding protein [Clostridiaceae bacterium]
MILYFSGTGNSGYVAQKIQHATGDKLISLQRLFREGKLRDQSFHSDVPYVFVCPTYAWRIPRMVEKFILNNNFRGERRVYFILTCGSEVGNAVRYVRKLCTKKNFTLMGFDDIVMPENYAALFDCPTTEEAKKILVKAKPKIETIAELIAQQKLLPESKARAKFLSLSNGFFYLFCVRTKLFEVTNRCISCGKCAARCPTQTITMQGDPLRPVWGKKCTHCMACICGCPARAIEYGKNTRRKPRYFLGDQYLDTEII